MQKLIDSYRTKNELIVSPLNKSNMEMSKEDLQINYKKDGYIYLPKLLQKYPINELFEYYKMHLEYMQFISQKSEDNINNLNTDILKSKLYKQITENPVLYEISETLLNEKVSLVPRKIIRFKPPFSRGTGAHIDQTYLRCGSDQFLTIWIPLGDTSIEMGGLMYLEKSAYFGKAKEQSFEISLLSLNKEEQISRREKGMGKKGWLTEDLAGIASIMQSRWLSANYEVGDIVIHSPYIIHAAVDNQDPLSRIRLSTDIRFQLAREQGDYRWQKEWALNDGL